MLCYKGEIELEIQTAITILVIAFIIVGVIQLFAGFRYIKLAIGLYGFTLGTLMPALIMHFILKADSSTLIFTSFFGGLLGATIALILYYFSIFLIGAVTGAIMAYLIQAIFSFENTTIYYSILGILTAAGGTLFIIFRKWLLIVATSIIGGLSILAGITYFRDGSNLDRYFERELFLYLPTSTYIIVLLLGAGGAYVQYRFTADQSLCKLTKQLVQWLRKNESISKILPAKKKGSANSSSSFTTEGNKKQEKASKKGINTNN